jgi:hypothetical protein
MSIKSKDITKLQAENLWGRLSEDVKEKIISEVKSSISWSQVWFASKYHRELA